MAIAAEHRLASCFPKDQITWRGCPHDIGGPDIARAQPPFDQVLGVLAAVVIDHQQFRLGEVLVEPERL